MHDKFIGRWRVTDADDCFVYNGVITVGRDGRGEFEFESMHATMTCEYGQFIMHFDWDGNCEGDDLHGNGWIELDEADPTLAEMCVAISGSDEFEFSIRKKDTLA